MWCQFWAVWVGSGGANLHINRIANIKWGKHVHSKYIGHGEKNMFMYFWWSKMSLRDTIIDYRRTLSANEQQFGGSYSSFDHKVPAWLVNFYHQSFIASLKLHQQRLGPFFSPQSPYILTAFSVHQQQREKGLKLALAKHKSPLQPWRAVI